LDGSVGVQDLAGKVAVVTGGARGLGYGLVGAFAESGMRIVIADFDEAALGPAVESVRSTGAEAVGVVADVTDAASVERLRDEAFQRFGTVHVLCNNAATAKPQPSLCEPIDVGLWQFTMTSCVYSVLHGLNAFLPRMLEQGDGHIVNTASRVGLVANPILGAYSPAKAAVVSLSEMLHRDLSGRGSPVGVTVLTPGGVKTPALLDALAAHERGDVDDREMRELLAARVADAVEPIDVGRLVVRAIQTDTFYVNTHRDTLDWLAQRSSDIVADADRIGTIR
jgi:NAD(P)-dependent dehydrogenase (short-subunit alcohol dehydrogenase family)